MSLMHRQNEIKLDILHSLARSQKALATMIESMAETVKSSSGIAEPMLPQIEVLGRYQRVLAEKLLGMRLREIRNGTSEQPWLSEQAKVSSKSAE